MSSKSRQRRPFNAPTKTRLTHFISIPLGHHVALRERWTRITSELLAATPPIPGLHTSIFVPPRSLHLTLGVLSLADSTTTQSTSQSQSGRKHTIADALRVLQSLQEPINALLGAAGEPLMVPLERLDVMDNDPDTSNILWAGPDVDAPTGAPLLRICQLVHNTFLESGLLQDTRPLKLHCTLVNTVYRRPSGKRMPFSCTALRSSAAYRLIAGKCAEDGEPRPWRVDLGAWSADEVQLCEMGRTADGTYRSVGAVTIGQ